MKCSELKASITVRETPKKFAIIITMLDELYCGDRERIIRQLVRYYQVTV